MIDRPDGHDDSEGRAESGDEGTGRDRVERDEDDRGQSAEDDRGQSAEDDRGQSAEDDRGQPTPADRAHERNEPAQDANGSPHPGREGSQRGGPPDGDDENLGEAAGEATGSRLGAYLVDFALLSAASVAVFFVMFLLASIFGAVTLESPGGSSDAAYTLLAYLMLFVTWVVVGLMVFGYFSGLDARGGTIGKRLLDVEVVTEDGNPPSYTGTAIRTAILLLPLPVMALLGIVLSFLGFMLAVTIMAAWLLVEGFVMLVSDESQRLGDKLADTYVVEAD